MADRFRSQSTSCMLSPEEHRALRQICTDLGLTVRDVLLIGLRRCQARLAIERRRQRLDTEQD
jgi:hypothetical protein